jgi:hypothetical protein
MHSLDDLVTRVTPAQAKDWRTNDNFIGQRDLRMWHGRLLAQLMEAGKFRSGSKIEFCELGGKLYLIDGQHTCFGVEVFGRPVDLLVVKKRVDTMEEVQRRYATFGRELRRTPADVYNALGLGDELKLDARTMQSFAGAVRIILNDLRRVSVVIDARIANDAELVGDNMPRYLPHLQTFLHSIDLATPLVKNRLNTTYVIAMALAILEGANDEIVYRRALAFLSDIAMNDGLRRGDPAKAAVEYIVSSDPRSMGTTTDRLRTLASAWNRYLRGRQMEFLRKSPIGPISFHGTRFASTSEGRDSDKPQHGRPGRPRRLRASGPAMMTA